MPWIAPKIGVIDSRGKVFCAEHEASALRGPDAQDIHADSAEPDHACDFPGCGKQLTRTQEKINVSW